MSDKPTPDPLTGVYTTGHEWDGIQELNNPIPKWWQVTYFVTVAWAIGFMILYPAWPSASDNTDGMVGHSNRLDVSRALADHAAMQAPLVSRITEAEDLNTVKEDQDLLRFAVKGGEVMFNDRCAGCHARGGGGQLNYPSLADDAWIWGGGLDNILATIRYGVRASHPDTRGFWPGSMPVFGNADAWIEAVAEDQIETQITQVAEYVALLSEGPEAIAAAAESPGATLYADNCASCHNAIDYDTGEETIGGGNPELGAPALNDAIWLYGGSMEEISAQIRQPQFGQMPHWEGVLDEHTIRMVALYVDSLNVDSGAETE